jgi:hypothetical protein
MSSFSDAVLALSPWAYYPMDEAVGDASLLDASPNTRNAAFAGTRAEFAYTEAHPNFERGVAFQSSSRAVLPARPDFIAFTRSFTVGFVGRLATGTDWFHPILSNTLGSVEAGFSLVADTRAGIGRDKAILLNIASVGTIESVIVENVIPDGDDHFFTLEGDGSNFLVYVDGQLAGQAVLPAKTATCSDDVTIGAGEFNNTWYDAAPNAIGQLFILERPLTNTERNDLYNKATQADSQGPTAGVTGQITGAVTVNGSPAVRNIIGITYEPQTVVPDGGDPYDQRLVVGETVSAEDGTYTLSTGDHVGETIVLALEDYGETWKPNQALEVGDRLRPTHPNQNGYVYEVTIAGTSDAQEPAWIIPTGAVTTMAVGTATVQGLPLFWSLAHAPILPEQIGEALPTDPLWSSVALYLDAEQEGGLNVIVDRSLADQTIQVRGDAALSEALPGLRTIYLDGNGDYLEIANSAAFNPQQALTYEGFVWLPAGSRSETQMLFSARTDSGGTRGVNLGIKTDGKLLFYGWRDAGGAYFENTAENGGAAVPTEQLTHFAMCRSESGEWSTWVGGQLSYRGTESGLLGQGASTFYIGRQRDNNTRYLKAHLKHLRWTSGEARYSAPFTPPEAPFPQQ